MLLAYLGAFLGALSISFVLTWYVRNVAMRRGWALAMLSDRNIHTDPVPRLGGVAIFIAFALTAVAGFTLFAPEFDPAHVRPAPLLAIMAGGILIFALGLYDDFRSASPALKLSLQVIAAAILFAGGLRIEAIPLLSGREPLEVWLSLPLTIFWVLLITNAFNLIDGLDGLAAGSALFSTLTVFVVSLVSGNAALALLTVCLAGAVLGFLRFNFNPATIFLGDCGSLFIGFMLSALALSGAQKSATAVAVAIPIVSFGLPVLETAISVVRRFISGQPIFGADRQHIHHKLLERGLSQRQAVVLLYAVSAAFGLLSLSLLSGSGVIAVVLFVIGMGIWLGVQHLGYHEFVELGRVAQRTIDQKTIIINNLAIRRATERLARVQSLGALCVCLFDAFRSNDFDGFRLVLNTWRVEWEHEFEHLPLMLREGEGGQVSLNWDKFEVLESRIEPKWNLQLQLVTESGERMGTLYVHRSYGQHHLLADINLLTSEFPVALADALQRVMREPASQSVHSAAKAFSARA